MTSVRTQNLTTSRKALVYVATAIMFFVGVASAGAAGLLGNSGTVTDYISNLAAQAGAAGGSAPSVTNPVKAAPVTKLSANGRLTESLGSGPCTDNTLAVMACSSTSCDFINMTGQLNATGLGKSNLAACFTLFTSGSGGASLGSGLGLGTLTTANGNVVKIAFGGDVDIDDEITTTPITLFLSMNLAYVVEGGTGPFLTETGAGNISATDIIANPSGSGPFPGTGEISINGNLSKN